MTLYSKEDKLVLISQMPENPHPNDKLDFLKKIFDLRFPSELKRITKDNLSDPNNLRHILYLYALHITPEKIDEMEESRQYFLNEENQKKCLNCSNKRQQDEFVKYWAKCIYCLEMTAEEANAKGEERERLKSEGVLCSTCNSRKFLNEYSIKKDGSHMKTCISCVNKKKKKPEVTPEPNNED